MKYPTPGAYQEAVQLPSTAFSDPVLQEAEPEATLLGLPRAITGAFAVVFPMQSRGARWAVKCFVTHVKDQEERYRAVAAHLKEAGLPHTVPFEFQPEGIQVDGRRYPILKMAWVDAETLNRYVARHLDRPEVLEALVDRWREMIDALEEGAVAHGDLQHGNVLVEPDGRLRLVDYDTAFVPALRGRGSPEVGHRNYQHADRDETDFGPYLDRFPALVIDTGLRACAAAPELWAEFDSGENILFRSDDLADPDASPLFARLERIDGLRDQVGALKRACYLEPEDVPPLAIVTSDAASVPETSTRKPAAEKGAFERFVYPAAAVILAVVALVQLSDSLAVVAAVAAAGLALATVVAWIKYRQLPPVRRRRRLDKEEAYFDRLLAGLREENARLEVRRGSMQGTHEARYDERLEEVKEEALQERLKYHFISDAGEVDGITHKVIVRLKASGIRTAAHATPERVGEIVQMSDESKARVNMWRASLVSKYRDEVPDALSPAEERRLARSLEREMEAVDAELARLRSKIAVQEEEREKIRHRRRELDVPSFAEYAASLIGGKRGAHD